MNKLTITKVALGSLSRRRGQYKAMIIGAGLAIFFVSSLFLAVQSIYETFRQAHFARYGFEDALLRDAGHVTPEEMLASGFVSEVGSVFVLGETEGTASAVGCYDEAGLMMANRKLTEGRMPDTVGELAVEPNFLQKMRSEAKVGDEITLTLKVPRGVRREFLPETVTKTYHIVGVLAQQSTNLEGGFYTDTEYLQYPSAIAYGKEQVELGGRAIVHRMVKLAPGATFEDFNDYAQGKLDRYNALDTSFAMFSPRGVMDNANGQIMLMIVGILGGVLILAACIGIVNAFSGSLSQRRSQIGMMRAVGATSRQIRSIFGREALLLALLIAPIGIGLSFAFVWGLTRWMGMIELHWMPWFLPLDLITSLLVVALAAWLPLLSASKVPPMQAIREVSLLRAKKRMRVKQRASYSAPRLIAVRHLSLYRTRQSGIAVMVALSVLLIAVGVSFVQAMWSQPAIFGYQIDGWRQGYNAFIDTNVNAHAGLTDGDLAELRTLPLVEDVDAIAPVRLNLLVDEITSYSIYTSLYGFFWSKANGDYDIDKIGGYAELKALENVSQELLPTVLNGCDDAFLESLRPHVLEGEIDMDALNAGREVLVVAPKVLYRYVLHNDNGYPYYTIDYEPPKDREDVAVYENDVFHAGDELSMLRLFTRGEMPLREDGTGDYERGLLREEATATIGAVLDEEAMWALSDFGQVYNSEGTLLTTHTGLGRLGFELAGYNSVGLRLSASPDDATHKYLTDTLLGIASRGNGMGLTNNVQSDKDQKMWRTVLQVCLAALILLLMSMCVSLVNNAVTTRVRSDKRAIGTLRAVGAPLPDIVSSYWLQVLAMIGWGVVGGLALSAAFFVWGYTVGFAYKGLVLLFEAVFLLAVGALCAMNLSARIREITRNSIVSNIREL